MDGSFLEEVNGANIEVIKKGKHLASLFWRDRRDSNSRPPA